VPDSLDKTRGGRKDATCYLMDQRWQLIKGTVSRDFRPLVFFHQSTPPRALTHRLQPFRIWLRIRRKKSTLFEFQRCQWQRWNHFRGVNDSAETVSAVSMTSPKQFQRYQWHRWNHHDHEV
jgi:hypothetical protein